MVIEIETGSDVRGLFAERPDVFVSGELTVRFRDSGHALRLLCHGMTIYDRGWLQRHSGDVEVCAAYLREHGIRCELSQAPGAATAPLTRLQHRRLAELFPLRFVAAA